MQDGLLLPEEQLQCLEKIKQAKEAHGEIETKCPRYIGSQDTYFVDKIKGIECIYQPTFADTYSREPLAK